MLDHYIKKPITIMNSQNKQDQVEEGVHQSHDSADPSLLNDNVPSGSNLSPADKSANQGHISGDEIESKSKNCEDIVHPSNRETPQTMKSKSDSADYLMNSGKYSSFSQPSYLLTQLFIFVRLLPPSINDCAVNLTNFRFTLTFR